MDKETPELKGWRSFKFRFGAEISERIDTFIAGLLPKTESIGDGCYHTVVDNDELDAQ